MGSSADSLTAFSLAKKRIRHRQLSKHLGVMIDTLNSGVSVSDACKILQENGCLDGISWSMISSAEKSGSLRDSCSHVAEYLAASAKVRKSLVSSLAYPIGVVLLASSMIFFLISFIFPKITPLFLSLHAPMPPMTAGLMLASTLATHYSLYGIAGILLLGTAFIYFYRTNDSFRLRAQIFAFAIPIAGRILFARESHGLALSCSVLMKGGKSLSESLAISAASSKNLVIRLCLLRIQQEIDAGKSLADILHNGKVTLAPLWKFFVGEWTDLVTVGEVTGTLPQSFAEIAACYEGRLKEDLELISRWAEPAALGASAGVILMVAMSVIQPMYAILQYVHS